MLSAAAESEYLWSKGLNEYLYNHFFFNFMILAQKNCVILLLINFISRIEGRTKIRLKALDVLSIVLSINKHLYEVC